MPDEVKLVPASGVPALAASGAPAPAKSGVSALAASDVAPTAPRARPVVRLLAKHSLATRIFHWINVPVLFVMIWSGLLIYWSNDVYEIRLFDWTLFKFFPSWFYSFLMLDHRLATGMAWHFAFGWIFAINGMLYFAHWVISGEWREMAPTLRSFPEAFQVVLHDLHLRKQPLPPGKFNAAQRISYTGVVFMGAASVLTGLAMYKPVQLSWLCSLLGGYQAARLEHFILTLGYALFFIVHVSQVIKAGWNNFRSMVVGYEVAEAPVLADAPDGKASAPPLIAAPLKLAE